MFDFIHTSAESQRHPFAIPAAHTMPIQASPHRFPTLAHYWPQSAMPTHAIREVLVSRTYTGADG